MRIIVIRIFVIIMCVMRILVIRIIVIVILLIIIIVNVLILILVIVVMLIHGLEQQGLRLLLGHGVFYDLGIARPRPHGREGFGALAALVSVGGGARLVLEPIWLRRIG